MSKTRTKESVKVTIKDNGTFLLTSLDDKSIIALHKVTNLKRKLYHCSFECTASIIMSVEKLALHNSILLYLPTVYVEEAFKENYWNKNTFYIDNNFNICKYYESGQNKYLIYFRILPKQEISGGCYAKSHIELCYYDLNEIKNINLAKVKWITPKDKKKLQYLFEQTMDLI